MKESEMNDVRDLMSHTSLRNSAKTLLLPSSVFSLIFLMATFSPLNTPKKTKKNSTN
jgi:hypothetical protein